MKPASVVGDYQSDPDCAYTELVFGEKSQFQTVLFFGSPPTSDLSLGPSLVDVAIYVTYPNVLPVVNGIDGSLPDKHRRLQPPCHSCLDASRCLEPAVDLVIFKPGPFRFESAVS